MPSRRTTDRFGAARRRTNSREGALRRTTLASYWVTASFAAAALALTAPPAVAQPQLFGNLETACPDAVLPLRIATFQGTPGVPLDALAEIALDEFGGATAWVALRRRAGEIAIAILAYAGNRAEALVVEVSTPEGEVTWRAEVPVVTPDPGLGGSILYPVYVVAPVPRAAWGTAFPRTGPYVLRAFRGPRPPITYVDGFCTAEARSWVVVFR